MNDIVDQVIEKRLTYLAPGKLGLLMDTIEKLSANGVQGDLLEFGIALGGSAICIASKLAQSRRFYGFDNFDLIPSPEPIDGERPNNRYEIIKSGQSSGINGDTYYGYETNRLALVTWNFEQFGMPVDGDRIVLVKGLFQDTLPSYLTRPVAFAHIDCDWYSPVKLCLEEVFPLLPVGGTIVVDDYNHWEGCTKATDEFCGTHPQLELAVGPTYATLVRSSI